MPLNKIIWNKAVKKKPLFLFKSNPKEYWTRIKTIDNFLQLQVTRPVTLYRQSQSVDQLSTLRGWCLLVCITGVVTCNEGERFGFVIIQTLNNTSNFTISSLLDARKIIYKLNIVKIRHVPSQYQYKKTAKFRKKNR